MENIDRRLLLNKYLVIGGILAASSLMVFGQKHDPRKFLKLHADFIGEEEKSSKYQAVYLNSEERKKYEIKFLDGKLFTKNGSRFNTGGMKNGVAYYVLSKDEIFYSSRRKERLIFEHSSYVAGGDVICAGHIRVKNGELLSVSDMSAQYVSHPHYNLNLVLEYLKKNGIKLKNVKIMNWVDY